MTLSLKLGLLRHGCLLAGVALGLHCRVAHAQREVVNFDFAWKHKLNAAPPQPSPGPAPPPAPPPSPWPPGKGPAKCAISLKTQLSHSTCTAGKSFGCYDGILGMWIGSGCRGVFECDDKATTCNDHQSFKRRINCTCGANHSPPTDVHVDATAIAGSALATSTRGVPPPQAAGAYDDSTWQIVDAPHDMLIHQDYSPNNNKKMAYIARNSGWYRKHFKIPADWKGSSVWIYIEGVFHETTSYLNGKQIGFHPAGYTSFWLRLDNVPGLEFGDKENVLALFVNATTGTGWWYEGGGLSRHSQLVRANPTHIEQDSAWIFTNQTKGGGATFHASVPVANDGTAPASVEVKSTIYDASGAVVATQTSPPTSILAHSAAPPLLVSASVASGVKLWTVQSPHLYTATIEVLHAGTGQVIDTLNITTGVRTVRFDADEGLFLNDVAIKMRGFCDHSSWGGVGAAVADRIELFRAQALRAVGGNAWRMAHNPPAISRLDYMDALGMLALDENRDYGGHHGQGGTTEESVADELNDMRDLIKRDRSHPSVVWWSFCNEVGCNNESSAKAFREVSKLWDPTRAVTQNHHGSDLSSAYLDVQGFSHRKPIDFAKFKKAHPTQPMAATECCSCMSQRGVDEDVCPNPKDGGCEGGPNISASANGIFYNNNIGKCTADQVKYSDSLKYVAGTFVWSGFDYLGEARGWPQNTKCRGTVSDVVGFTKETAYWLRSVWLSNISRADPGRPLEVAAVSGMADDSPWTVFIVESWLPPLPGTGPNRNIHVYTNAPRVTLSLNGKPVGASAVEYFDAMATFSVPFAHGNLTAIAHDHSGQAVGSHSITSTGVVAAVVLSIDVPSVSTGTGSSVVADGEDVAMIRATLVDSSGLMVPSAAHNITFSIESGPGKIWTTHNGNPANLSPNDATWNQAYHGLARAIIRTTADHATSAAHRSRMLEIDVDSGRGGSPLVVDPTRSAAPLAPIVLKAVVPGLPPATVSIPTTADLRQLPMAVATSSMASLWQ